MSFLNKIHAESKAIFKKALVSWVEGRSKDLLQLYNEKPEYFPTSKPSTKIMYRAVGLYEGTFNDIMDGGSVQPQLLESWTSSKSAVMKHMKHLLTIDEDLVAIFESKPKKILLKVYDYLTPSDADFDYSSEEEYIVVGESLAKNSLLLVKDDGGEYWYTE